MKIIKTSAKKLSVAYPPNHINLTIKDLEFKNIPKSTFLQDLLHPLKEDPFRHYATWEERARLCEHRLALIRTIATSINVIATICVLLRVFKVI